MRVVHVALLLLVSSLASAAAEIAPGERRSSFDDMSPETRAMQRDDTLNPASLWVLEGEALWNKPEGEAGQSCASCHGDAATSMKGVAARYPAFDPALGRPVTLEQRVNLCRTGRQKAPELAFESQPLLGLTAFVGRQSRGLPIEASTEPASAPFLEAGRELFTRRIGQLNLSCAGCHDDNWGRRLAGNPIPQGHPTGYPIYRLEWQGMGSLQRRLRNCMTGVRAEPYAYGSPEFVALEFYLKQRAAGLPLETPAVRP